MERQITRNCECGCGHFLHGSRLYFPGHKPKRINKTHEERSEVARKMWDERGRKEIVLRPCACGCGESTKGEWVHGHFARIHNPSKLEHVRKMRRQNFLKLHEEGRLKPWNRGLDDSDPRVDANSEGLRKWARSEEGRKKSAEYLRRCRLDGTIPTKFGPDHPTWKGGTSTLTQRMRSNHDLYKLWKRPILERDGFRCRDCKRGSSDVRLHVHHDSINFAQILHEELLGLFPDAESRKISWEEGAIVCKNVVDRHIRENISGVTVCRECHGKRHESERSHHATA